MRRVANHNRNDASQESQYAFPYHYIPTLAREGFSQHVWWSWGYRYIAGVEMILQILAEMHFESLVDIGCGDGRLVREAAKHFPDRTVVGVDVSERAIQLAQALNPQATFYCHDICEQTTGSSDFDIAVLHEVLEHIPKESLATFATALTRTIRPNGHLLLTVPHNNLPVSVKHVQHFSSEKLSDILQKDYVIERWVFLDPKAPVFEYLIGMFLANRFFILNNHCLLHLLFRIYRRRFFVCKEDVCTRICLAARKR